MTYIESLNQLLDQWHLLNHPVYQSWTKGTLSRSVLQAYAKEYYHHVAAFPRYISSIHSLSPDLKTRQILLGNLIEEEQGEDNHPELWQRFGDGLGLTRSNYDSQPQLSKTKELVDGYFDLVRTDFAAGIGALYAYERQTPAVSKSKIEGLETYYDVTDEASLQFFKVHMEADIWHSDECAGIISNLTPEEQTRVSQGAEKGAKLLWGFLDGIHALEA